MTSSVSDQFHAELHYLAEQGYGPAAARLRRLWEQRALEAAVYVAELLERCEQAERDRDGLRCPAFVGVDEGD